MSDWSKLGQAVPFRLQNLLFIYLFACLFINLFLSLLLLLWQIFLNSIKSLSVMDWEILNYTS